jgi:guanidinoacetate N-methyltransferase
VAISINSRSNGRQHVKNGAVPQYPATDDEWSQFPVEITENELLIGGWQVMQAWERPLMEVLAREASTRHGDVLEVGFGMGMAARLITEFGCSSYTTIEAHPAIAAMARAWAKTQDISCTVYEGMWQDVVPQLSTKFDGILFDTFPLSAEERGRNHFPFIPEAARLLRNGGAFVCYSDETVDFRSEHLELLLAEFDEVKLVKVSDLSPGQDCEYWKSTHMVVPVARRNE